ncbi:MAG: RHS repeat-associated core domain-containing protein [Saprospiraceae bacterium]|nr:RHS repeat-associated core domain-containing protein [Saprospiraceae bacterium]
MYNGKEWVDDLDVGLYAYGARYYDPAVGRFTGVDPLADQFPGWSPYNYTMNNPINMIDPDGRAPMDVDDWILRENGNIEYDASVTSEQDVFNKYGGSATYLGSAGTI